MHAHTQTHRKKQPRGWTTLFTFTLHCTLTCPGGVGNFFLRLALPLHARMTVLWRWRWISASSWFQSLSCSAPLMSRPSSWICCILERHRQRVGPSINSCCWQTSLAHPQAWGHLLVCFWHTSRRTDHETRDVAKYSFLDWGQSSVVFWRKTHMGCCVVVLENRDGLPSSCKTRNNIYTKDQAVLQQNKKQDGFGQTVQ